MTLGARLARARKARHMSMGQLAEALGLSAQTISDYEHDRRAPNPRTLEMLRSVLGWREEGGQ